MNLPEEDDDPGSHGMARSRASIDLNELVCAEFSLHIKRCLSGRCSFESIHKCNIKRDQTYDFTMW